MGIFNALQKTSVAKNVVRKFAVYSTAWHSISRTEDFELDKPKVIMLQTTEGRKSLQRPLYVLRSQKGYKVFDMHLGGEYEWKVFRGQLLVRRRLSG